MPTRKTSRRPATKVARSARTSPSARRSPAKVSAPIAPAPSADESAAKPPAAKPAKDVKPPKLHRKPVRDSFTMPEADFSLIATLKARALAGQRETKKSELLRAGLHALASLDTPDLVAALSQLEPVKVGRPKKHH